jgi:hypothetical protein
LIHISKGIYTALFLYTVHAFGSFYSPWEDIAAALTHRTATASSARKSSHLVLMGLIALLFACYMINLGSDWGTVDSAFVKHASTADSTMEYLANAPVVTSGLIPELFRVIALLIADGILVCGLIQYD